MDAFELLKADHKKVAQLFDSLESASGKAKMDVFKQIKNELDLHTHIEETIFYPALEKPEETHDLTLEAYEEHKVVKALLAELAGATAANDEWDAKAKVLRENVEHHVDEEENELFDKADDALSDEEIEALGNRMEAEKARKQGRPAPTQTAAKKGKTDKGKASDGEPGILSKIAEFVGLGSDTANKRTAKKKPAKKTAVKKGSKTGAQKKAGAKKKVETSASKRSAAGQGSKRAASRPSRSTKATGASSRKKAAKKRVGRK
jgi:hemerythrin-like domain-containing protein